MFHLNLFASHAIPLIFAYGSLVVLISMIRAWTPHISLEDHRLNSVQQEEFLNVSKLKHQSLQAKFPIRSPSRDLAITIVTANRAQPYIHAVLGSLFDAYGVDLPPVTLCSVESHSYGEIEQLRRERWSVVEINKDYPFNTSVLSLRIAKETGDYWKCLNLTRNSEARYTLLLEDDIFVHERFRGMVESLTYQMDTTSSHVDYAKLYHINRLRHISSMPQIIGVCLLLSSLLHWLLAPRPVLTLIGYLVLLIHLNNQGNLFPADFRYSLTDSVYLTMSESCCTPAVFFRTASIPAIVDALIQEKSFAGHAKDHILDESRFVGRETDFNLVSHIGLISSLRRNQP
uniref:Glycosyltransferase XRE-1 n=3 Tax=Pristionchus pacificus TaxID=54126 RepID=D6BPQ9_PRIPA|nr:glycosyltransferase XRE-1 [Pristionchus pacificus]ADA57112.1 putative glycosyltransferase [Pristionchus pacificus]